ncbi:UNVERIFIED_CONTAM: hypothetical protein FKN15_043523 [Acipenser sinensis]
MEMAIVDMVVAQNDTRLRDIQKNILGNNETFQGVETISTTTIACIERNPYQQATLIQAMEETCEDITAQQCQAWKRHSKRYFPRCLANENINCDVDENLWPNAEQRIDH